MSCYVNVKKEVFFRGNGEDFFFMIRGLFCLEVNFAKIFRTVEVWFFCRDWIPAQVVRK